MLHFVDLEAWEDLSSKGSAYIPAPDTSVIPMPEVGPKGTTVPMPEWPNPEAEGVIPMPGYRLPDKEGLFEDDLFIDKRKPPESLTGVIPL